MIGRRIAQSNPADIGRIVLGASTQRSADCPKPLPIMNSGPTTTRHRRTPSRQA